MANKKVRSLVSLIITICFLAIPLFGCSSSNKIARGPNTPQGQRLLGQNLQTTPVVPSPIVPKITPNTLTPTPHTAAITFDQAKALKIKNGITKMVGVRSANVIVSGTNAVVWYKLAPKSTVTKSNIITKAKQIDTTITNVYAGTSTKLMKDMKLLLNDIAKSKTVSNLNTKFTNLIRIAK